MTHVKKRLSLTAVGHPGCGKSTLIGHILCALGDVDPEKIKATEAKAADRDKRSSRYAMMLDQEGQEWDEGCTKECKLRPFDTPTASLTIIDAPGKPEYQRAIVSGLSGVDAIILVVDATEGKFEEGMAKTGQTRTHALLAYAFGIRSVVVAVTQLDNLVVPYSRKRYDWCQSEVIRYLKRVGFVQDRVTCLPVSGLCGDNIVEPSKNLPWHKGPTLIEQLAAVDTPKRISDRPLRVVLFAAKHEEQKMICQGRVEYGNLRSGMQVVFMPGGLTTDIKSLEANGSTVASAQAGDIVGFTVTAPAKFDVHQGTVVSDANHSPSQTASMFVAQLIQLNAPLETKVGSELSIDICTACARCKVTSLLQKIDRRSGKVLEESPAALKAGEVGFCRMETLEPVCIEAAVDFPLLGRFCVRQDESIVAVGMVKSVEKHPLVSKYPALKEILKCVWSMGTVNLFVYGTLMAEPIAKGVVGRVPSTSAAVLKDHVRYRIKGAPYPAIMEKPDEQVTGQLLMDLTASELITLDRYEGVALERAEYEADEYERLQVTVQLEDGSEATAFAYVWQAKYRSMLEEVPWDFEAFMKTDYEAYWREEMEDEMAG